jgi:hypothetical protein
MTSNQKKYREAENALTAHLVAFGTCNKTETGRMLACRALLAARKYRDRAQAKWLVRHCSFITGGMPRKH